MTAIVAREEFVPFSDLADAPVELSQEQIDRVAGGVAPLLLFAGVAARAAAPYVVAGIRAGARFVATKSNNATVGGVAGGVAGAVATKHLDD